MGHCQRCGKEFHSIKNGRWGNNLCSKECRIIRHLKQQRIREMERLDKRKQKINDYLRKIGGRKYGYFKVGEYWKDKINLTKEDISNLIDKPCYYSGRLGDPIYGNGIDRVNNDKGYVKENVVPCHKDVNFAKKQLSQEEFAKLIIDCYPWASTFLNDKPFNSKLVQSKEKKE